MVGYIFLGIVVLLVLAILVNFKKIVPFVEKTKKFFGEVNVEMHKVTWPAYQEVVNMTMLVVVSTIALTGILWLVDLVIGKAVQIIFTL